MVVRSLSRLPAFAPSRGFEDAVMARLVLREPRPVALYRRARAWAAEPRRALTLAGAYAVAALISLGVVVPWLLAHGQQISFGMSWAAAHTAALGHRAWVAFTGWSLDSGLAGRLQSFSLSAPAAVTLGVLAAVAYAGCALGLHFLLRSPRGLDAIPAQA